MWPSIAAVIENGVNQIFPRIVLCLWAAKQIEMAEGGITFGSGVGEVATVERTDSGWLFSAFDAAVSWLLGVSLICSCVPHLGNPYFFLGSVYSYKLVGPGVGQIVAMTLPFLQLVLASCLLTSLFRDAAHTITVVMLVAFAAAQTTALIRDLGISCGCFAVRHESEVGWFSLSLIYGLLLLAVTRLIASWWVEQGREGRR